MSIWHGWDEAHLPALLKRIAAFQDIYPNVQFDVLYVPPLDLLSSYRQACLDGYAPALLIGPADWGPELFMEGCIAPLEEVIASDNRSRLNPASLAASGNTDHLLGAPLTLDGVVLYRNPRLVPVEAATYTEVVEYSQAAADDAGIGAYLDRSPYFSGGHLYGLGGNFFRDGLPAFYDEYGLTWVRLLQSFAEAGPVDYFSDLDYESFLAGEAAYLVETTQRRHDIEARLGESGYVIDPWPVHDQGELAGFIQVECAFLRSGLSPESSKVNSLFLRSLLTLEGQLELAEADFIPAYNSATESGLTARVQIIDPIIAQAMIALSNGVPYPHELTDPELRAILDTYLQAIFTGELGPSDGLQQAAAVMESQLLSVSE